MKVITGLVPRVREETIWPKYENGSPAKFPFDGALPVLEPMPTVSTRLVTFATPEDTPERPAGTVVSAMLVTGRPKITQRTLDLDLWNDMEDEQRSDYVRYRMKQEGVPADALQVRTASHARDLTHLHFVWYEVET